jgi:NADPH:quinone reductase-like Zn-dependent oxidoreductase
VLDHMAAPIPNNIAFADAAVLPLGLGTAASGLCGRTQLALAPPLHSPTARPEVVLVGWIVERWLQRHPARGGVGLQVRRHRFGAQRRPVEGAGCKRGS